MFNNDFFYENRAIYEIMWKNMNRAGLATDDNMPHAHCMMDTKVYKYTLRICNTDFPLQKWSLKRASV
jgi:hypothetical protein